MSRRLVECVPNISEGRDAAKIKQVVDAISAVSGVQVLDVDPGADTNRTVITFVGEPDAVLAGAFACIAEAAKVIDMRQHHGAHPRMGATDVVPFVPVEGVTMEDCAELARRLGARVAAELAHPRLPLRSRRVAARTPQPGRGAPGRVRRPGEEASGSPVGAGLRRSLQPQRRRHDHRRPGVPGGLQRDAEQRRQGPRHGHRLRAAREGPRGPPRPREALLPGRRADLLRRGILPLRQLRLHGCHLPGGRGPLRLRPRLRPAGPHAPERCGPREPRGPEGPPPRPLRPLQGHRLVRGHLPPRPDQHQPHGLQANGAPHGAGGRPRPRRRARAGGHGQRDRGPGALPVPAGLGPPLPEGHGQVHGRAHLRHHAGRGVLHGSRRCGALRGGEEGAGPAHLRSQGPGGHARPCLHGRGQPRHAGPRRRLHRGPGRQPGRGAWPAWWPTWPRAGQTRRRTPSSSPWPKKPRR